MTFSEALDSASTPAPADFYVTVGSSRRDVASGGVAIAGAVVTLTLSSAVGDGDAVKVRYTKPANNPLQDEADNAVATFADQDVTNNTDTRAPTFQEAAVDGDSLLVTFSEALDSASTPAPADFYVTVGSSRRDVASGGVAIAGAVVTLTLSSAVGDGDAVKVRYTKPANNPLQDEADNAVATFADQDVTNNTDTRAPTFQEAAVDGDSLLVTFSEALDSASTPAPADFYVTVGSSRRDVASGGVAIAGAVVTLTLSSAVGDGDAVKVRYTKPANNPLQDEADNAVATFADQDVTNNTDTRAPTFQEAAVDGDSLLVTFSEALDSASTPAPADFYVTVGSSRRDVASGGVAIAGAVVTLTLSSAVGDGDAVKVRYTKPANNPLQDEADNAVATFADQDVTNNTDTRAPTFQEAAVDGDSLAVTFSEALDSASTPAPADFYVTVGSSRRDVASGGVAIAGAVVTLTLSSAVGDGDAVKVRYTKPANNPLQDEADNAVATFADQDVTNNTDTRAPTFQEAAVDGDSLLVTFSEALDSASTPAPADFYVTVGSSRRDVASGGVAIAGAVVTLTLSSAVGDGDAVKVRYTKPANNPLQDEADNAVATFADQDVTNNTDTRAPTFQEAAVDGDSLAVTFSEALDSASTPAPADFYVTVGSSRRDVASGGVAIAGAVVTLTLSSAVGDGDAVKVRYTKPANNPLQDEADNAVATFADQDVTNNTDTRAPTFQEAAVDGDSLLVTFSEALDSASTPAPADFYVTVGSSRRDVASGGVAIAGAVVTLTLSSAVGDGDAVKVRYTKPANNPLQDEAENAVATFADQDVTNNTDTRAPTFQEAAVDGDSLLVTFSEALDSASTPAPADFYVTVGSSRRDVASGGVAIAGAVVTLTLSSAVGDGDAVKVRYTKPANNPLQDEADNAVATFADQDVTNNTDTRAPTFQEAAVDGDSLLVTFSEALDSASTPAPADFYVTVGSSRRDVASGGVAIAGAVVTLTLSSAVGDGDAVKVRYTKPANNPLQDEAENAVATFADQDVTNNTDTRAPTFQEAAVDGDSLLVTFSEALDSASTPAPADFYVTVGSSRRDVASGGVAIAGAVVTLTLSSAVGDGDAVKVRYTKPANNPLQDEADNAVATFADQDVTNNTDTRAPTFQEAAVDGDSLLVTFSEALDSASTPAPADFYVTVGSSRRDVASGGVAIAGAVVTLTLSSAVGDGDAVKVRYTKPANNPLQDEADNAVATFADQDVTNNTDTRAPTFQEAAVDGDSLLVTFSEALDSASTPAPADFYVTVGSSRRDVASGGVAIAGAVVTLTLSSAVGDGDAVKVRYTKPANNPLQDEADNAVATFADQDVTNNTDTRAPTFQEAAVDGDSLLVTFSEALDSASTPAPADFYVTVGSSRRDVASGGVAIAGAVVTLTLSSAVGDGDAVKVRYTKPANNPLQDEADNAVATFADQDVTNNTDTRAPTFQEAAVDGDSLLVTFSEALDSASTPAPADFYVTVGSSRRDVASGGVAIAGAVVTLTLSSAVGDGDAVKVRYTKPANNPLQDEADNAVATFADQDVTNNTDTRAPTFQEAAVDGDSLLVTFSEALDSASTPAPADFYVTVGSSRRDVASGGVAIAGAVVTLTLSSAVGDGDAVKVRYTKPANNPLQDEADNAVATFADQDVTNNTDTRAPTFQEAAVDGDSLLVTFSEALDSASTPAPADFYVTVGSSRRDVASGGVAIAGAVVTLTLSSAVGDGDAVKVRYTKPANNPLQDEADNAVATFADQDVTNNTDTRAPTFQEAAVDGDSLLVTFSEALDSASTPAPADFYVTVGSSRRDVASGGVAIAGAVVTLTLSSAVGDGDAVKVRYTKPANNPLQDEADNAVATFADQDVTNNTDTRAPTFQEAAVDGDSLLVTFSEALDSASTPAPADFYVTVGSSRRDVASGGVAIAGAVVTLTLSSAVGDGDAVKVRYTKPANNPLQDEADNAVATFADQDVTNNTDTRAPTFQEAAVDGDSLLVTFSEALDSASTPAPADFYVTVGSSRRDVASGGVAIAGAVVTLTLSSAVGDGDAVKVRYTKPANNPLQDEADNAVATFADQDVTNNTDTRAPTFQEAAVDGDSLAVTFSEALDSASTPAPADFYVTVGSSRRDVASGGVAIAGAVVTLTLSSAVGDGDAVKVRYTKPANNPLQDEADNAVATFADQDVTNNTDTRAPTFQEAAVDGDSLLVTFSEALDSASTPAPADFYVTVGSSRRDVASGGVAIAGAVVTLTLSSAVGDGDAVKVRYTKPANNPLQDEADNAVATFADQDVTNNTDTRAPTFQEAAVDGDSLLVTFSEALDSASTPAPADFYVTVGSSRRDVASGGVAIAGAVVTLTLSSAVGDGDAVKVRYTKPANNPLQDEADNAVATFADQDVTNNTDTRAPTFQEAAVDGDSLLVTFSEALDSASTPAPADFYVTVGSSRRDVASGGVAIAGAVVTLTLSSAVGDGDAVKVRYTKPANNPLQDEAENAVATFADQDVTNNTDTRAPTFQEAAVDGDSLLVTFSEALDSASTPAPADFYVTVGSSRRDVASGGVAIAGAVVTLTLSSAVGDGDAVKVRYTKPANNPLQDEADNAVATFADQDVTNNTDTRAPTFQEAAVDGDSLLVTFSEALDSASTPAPADFYVTVGSSRRDVASGGVAIAGAVVTLTLSSAVGDGDAVKVRYTKPANNPLQDEADNAVATFADQDVTNNTDTRAPTFQEAAVDGDSLPPAFEPKLQVGRTEFLASPENPEFAHNIPDLEVELPSGEIFQAPFRSYFLLTGSIKRWGYPMSEVLVLEDGTLTQFYQYGVIDFHDVGNGYLIERRLVWDYIGGGLGGSPDQGTEPDITNPNPGTFLGPWGHKVSNLAINGQLIGFLDFFNTFGGVDAFGYPKTDARIDRGLEGMLMAPGVTTGVIRQYFQAAVFEFDPGNPHDPVKLIYLGYYARDLLVPDYADRTPFQPAEPLTPDHFFEPYGVSQNPLN